MALTTAERCRRHRLKHPEKYTAEARREKRKEYDKKHHNSENRLKVYRKYRQSDKRQDWYLRTNYGITLAQKKKMYADQAGLCLFCREPLKFELCSVDHSHRTGKVRGLLHPGCNTILGYVENNLRRCLDYLFRTGELPPATVNAWRDLLDKCEWQCFSA